MKKLHNSFLVLMMLLLTAFLNSNDLAAQRKASYVKPYVTRSGKIVRPHYRKAVSITPMLIRIELGVNTTIIAEGNTLEEKDNERATNKK